ncbi:MAG: hypothetical protein HN712_24275 [Gemmatimonadetes bacterium]|nr:hypothetical protein [Gemmatimonadota bacterium]MBT6147027.1 hypothetical protein [Gemmatimonadota bacterium]MBT7863454.1 hypothetical protein [Gemmatimonadota bacterium]
MNRQDLFDEIGAQLLNKQGDPRRAGQHLKPVGRLCDSGWSGILEERTRYPGTSRPMYENTIFEPIYGHSDLGSIAVAIFIAALSIGASLALGHVASMIGGDKS